MFCRDDILPLAVARHAALTPDRCFLRDVSGGFQSYADTDRLARELAVAFASTGVGKGDCVISFLPTSLDAANVWIGLSWLGAVTVPVNTGFEGDLLLHVMQNSKAGVMVCAERWLERVAHIAADLDHLHTIIVLDGGNSVPPALERFRILDRGALLGSAGPAEGLVEPELHDIAMMMYTSGTTGVSKGVLLPWGVFALASHNMVPRRTVVTPDDVMYLPFPLFHVSGTEWLAVIARVGASAVLREVFSTDEFWPDVRAHGCTLAMLVGVMASFIEQRPRRPDDAHNPLRVVTIIPALADMSAFEARFDVETCTLYGSTELGVVISSGTETARAPGCGFLRDQYEARIVDANDQDVADGASGELLIRPRLSWMTFEGYFEMPEATLKAFRNLWFHTGDLFRRESDGSYSFVDRLKDSIRRRGENISSIEVEAIVLKHEAIQECAAVGVPSELGEEEVKIVVSLRSGAMVDPAALIAFLVDRRMPRFMLPRYVEIMEALPKTPTGKIVKGDLRHVGQAWERPDANRRRAAASDESTCDA